MNRRNFISNTAAAAITVPFLPKTEMKKNINPQDLLEEHLPVNFTRDGINLSPTLYSQILQQLTLEKDFKPDSYGLGGMIHTFEEKVAKAFGKGKAIFMPTGTLANHIALRQHCIVNKRAIVQYESHINRDSGDCVSALSGINLITLGNNKVVYEINELQDFLNDNEKGKVKTPIGVLSIETPVRRKNLKRIPFSEIEKICKIARNNNIALHLDGARLYIDSAFSDKSIQDYTQLFDTVYLSLYKSFNSVNGAILAGPKSLIDGLHNERRMFGGGLASSWQQVAVANYFFDNYEERYKEAQKQFDNFKILIEKTGKYKISSLENGSNVFKLILDTTIDPFELKSELNKNEILIPNWNKEDKCFYIKLNDSLVYNNMEELAKIFIKV